jgi:hypothetical protein
MVAVIAWHRVVAVTGMVAFGLSSAVVVTTRADRHARLP